jgi:hypothetical protein
VQICQAMKKQISLIKFGFFICASAVLIYFAIANMLYGQTVEVSPTPIRISPADVFAEMCERAEERKPWTEPSPIPANVNRKIKKPFNVSVR